MRRRALCPNRPRNGFSHSDSSSLQSDTGNNVAWLQHAASTSGPGRRAAAYRRLNPANASACRIPVKPTLDV